MDESSSEQGVNTLITQICKEPNNVDQVSLYDLTLDRCFLA
jgi:hypothetical protein